MKLSKNRLAVLRLIAHGKQGASPPKLFAGHLNALARACLIRPVATGGYVLTPEGENCLKEHE